MSDQRGATEVLGFILAFAIITAAIGIIYTAGFGGLQDARDDEQLKNVERAFDVMAANIEEVRRFGVPSRSTEIRLREGRLILSAPTTINVTLANQSFQFSSSMRPISYVSNDEDTVITYEGGAVFRASGGQAVMLSPPGWIIDENRMVVPTMSTFKQDGPNSISTAGTALIVAQAFDRVTDQASGSPITVRVTVNTTQSRAGAWSRYFSRLSPSGEEIGDGPSDGQITYEFEVQSLRVIRVNIGVTLSP